MDIHAILGSVGEAHRRLQETAPPTASPTQSDAPVSPNDGEILRNTLLIWGSAYVIVVIIYGLVRTRYRRVFNIRSWADSVKSDLAQEYDNLGFLDWMWKLAWINDEDMRKECGMDSLCFLRVFRFGFKICLVGMFNSLWLCPIYATADVSSETEHISDPIASITVSNVPSESSRFIATTVSAYLIFGYTMYLLLQEFEWFTQQRHAWLSEEEARNYTVFVQGIPSEYRSSAKLLEYFRDCFDETDVLEARVALAIPQLEGKVNQRQNLVYKLEHAINLEEAKGEPPMLKNPLNSQKPRNAITVYAEELAVLNEEITLEKAALLAANDPFAARPDTEGEAYSYIARQSAGAGDISIADSVASSNVVGGYSVASSLTGMDTAFPVTNDDTEEVSKGEAASTDDDEPHHKRRTNKFASTMTKTVNKTKATMSKTTAKMNQTMEATAGAAMSVLKSEEGKPKESGFVTFSTLEKRQAALQMIHHPTTFVMDTFEAPDADDIFWPNCGRTHKDLQVGKVTSVVLTSLLCLFWTIPMSFIVSLTTVEELGEKIPWIGNLVDDNPWLGEVLRQLAPLVLIGVNELLKIFLEIFCMMEGPISGSVVEASLFGKLALFMIIQTFFVSAISGSIFSELQNIIDNPTSIVDLLATTLPGQSTYFLQILLVQTAMVMAMELLRISPIALAVLRSFISPKLTEKERNRRVMFLRPLSDPNDFEHADHFSNSVLYYMVLFVYSSTAPIVNWFLGLCFLILAAGYRNQFLFCYPITDSGGRLWITFIRIIPIAVFIGQLTLLGYLGLKVAGIAFILLIPLLIFTLLFNMYIGQEHYKVLEHLPSRECMKRDRKNSRFGRADLEFLKDVYLQPPLATENELQAENMSIAQEIAHTGAKYATPPASEADIEPLQEEDIIFEEFEGQEEE